MPFAKKLAPGQKPYKPTANKEKHLSIKRVGSLGRVLLVTASKGPYVKEKHEDAFVHGIAQYIGSKQKGDEAHQKLENFGLQFLGELYFRQTSIRGDNTTIVNHNQTGNWRSKCVAFLIDKNPEEMEDVNADSLLKNLHDWLAHICYEGDKLFAKNKQRLWQTKVMPWDPVVMNLTPKSPAGDEIYDNLDALITDNFCLNVYMQVFGYTEHEPKETLVLYHDNEDPLKVFTKHDDKGYACMPVEYFGFPTTDSTPAEDFTKRIKRVVAKIDAFKPTIKEQTKAGSNPDQADMETLRNILTNVTSQLKNMQAVETQGLRTVDQLLSFFKTDGNDARYGATNEDISTLSDIIGKFDPKTGKRLQKTQSTLDGFLQEEKDAENGDTFAEASDGGGKMPARNTGCEEDSVETILIEDGNHGTTSTRKRNASSTKGGQGKKRTKTSLGAKQVTASEPK